MAAGRRKRINQFQSGRAQELPDDVHRYHTLSREAAADVVLSQDSCVHLCALVVHKLIPGLSCLPCSLIPVCESKLVSSPQAPSKNPKTQTTKRRRTVSPEFLSLVTSSTSLDLFPSSSLPRLRTSFTPFSTCCWRVATSFLRPEITEQPEKDHQRSTNRGRLKENDEQFQFVTTTPTTTIAPTSFNPGLEETLTFPEARPSPSLVFELKGTRLEGRRGGASRSCLEKRRIIVQGVPCKGEQQTSSRSEVGNFQAQLAPSHASPAPPSKSLSRRMDGAKTKRLFR